MNGNIWDQGDQIETLLRSGRPVDATQLVDPAIDLADIAASS